MKYIYIIFSILLLSVNLWAQPNWTVNAADYEFSMNLTSKVKLSDGTFAGENCFLGAFNGETCCGVSAFVKVEKSNQSFALLSVFSNNADGDSIHFKIWDGSQEYILCQKIAFKADDIIGSPSVPYLLSESKPSCKTQVEAFKLQNVTDSISLDTVLCHIKVLIPENIQGNIFKGKIVVSEGATCLQNGLLISDSLVACQLSSVNTFDVIAENGVNKSTWTIDIVKDPNAHSGETGTESLVSFALKGQVKPPVINSASNTIEVYPPKTTNPNSLCLDFVTSKGTSLLFKDSVLQTGDTVNFENSYLTLQLITANSIEDLYIIPVMPEMSKEAAILSFYIPGQQGNAEIDVALGQVRVLMPENSELNSLVPQFTLSSGATVILDTLVLESGVSTLDFSSPVKLRVIAEDANYFRDWDIIVKTQNIGDGLNFNDFQIIGQIGETKINKLFRDITVYMPKDTDVSGLKPYFSLSEGASAYVLNSLNTSGVSVVDFTQTVVYEVCSAGKTNCQAWTVSVLQDSIEPQDTTLIEANLAFTSFGIDGFSIVPVVNLNTKQIEFIVPYSFDLTAVKPVFVLPNSVEVEINGETIISGESILDFTKPLNVTLINKAEKTYTNWLIWAKNAAPSGKAEILTFSVNEEAALAEINYATRRITLYVPEGHYMPEFTLSPGAYLTFNASPVISGKTMMELKKETIWQVVAEDGVTIYNWVIRLQDHPTAIWKLKHKPKISVIPNPGKGVVHISGYLEHENLLSIKNLAGKTVFTTKLQAQQQSLVLPPIASGIYILEVGRERIKLVLE